MISASGIERPNLIILLLNFSRRKGADEKEFDSDCFFLSFRFPVLRTHFFVVC